MKIPEQIHAGLIDGAVVLGGTGTEDFRRGAYGIADRMKQAPMQFDSVFDIASLTKVTGTAVLLAFCVEEGIIDLDAPFTEYLPYHGRLFSPVTVRQLATHYSGIQINYPYFPGEEKKMIEAILSLDFVRPPMTEYEYTCTNYILLGLLIERVMKKPLEQLAEERIFHPLGMNDTKWGAPVDGALSRTIRTINAAPGVISDHGARAIAPHRIGNAGIFSTASDLAKFCRMMLNRGRGIFQNGHRGALFHQSGAARHDAAFHRLEHGAGFHSGRLFRIDNPPYGLDRTGGLDRSGETAFPHSPDESFRGFH